MSIEAKLRELGYEISAPTGGKKPFVPVKQVGNLVFCSGHAPIRKGQLVYIGKVGGDCSLEEAKEAAKLCIANSLYSLKEYLGGLDTIVEIVSLRGFVNSTPGFVQQSEVMNAASEMLLDLFGEKGTHVRSAIGVSSLPKNFSVEVEIAVTVSCVKQSNR